MRHLLIIFILSIFESCTSTNHIQGSYNNVYFGIAGEKFTFFKEPNKFEYYSSTEGALKAYSSGTWKQDKRSIFLSGYDNKNINILNIKNNVKDYPNDNRDKIVVHYKVDPLDIFTKVDVIVNRTFQIRISDDTAFFVDNAVRTLLIKSYLAHQEDQLYRTSPLIDTLYSPEIKIADPDKHKLILLKVNVAQKDFYRVKLIDTLTVKNRRILLWHNKEFKKIKE